MDATSFCPNLTEQLDTIKHTAKRQNVRDTRLNLDVCLCFLAFCLARAAVLCVRSSYRIMLCVIDPLPVTFKEGSENEQIAVCGVNQ